MDHLKEYWETSSMLEILQNPLQDCLLNFMPPQTSRMKKDILSGIKNENSRMRVLFATSALGMGVHAPHVVNIIHITPPSSLEAYIQKIGRAGRTGLSSYATLYYNNYDIGNNMKHVEESMKTYCKSQQNLSEETSSGLLWILQCSIR